MFWTCNYHKFLCVTPCMSCPLPVGTRHIYVFFTPPPLAYICLTWFPRIIWNHPAAWTSIPAAQIFGQWQPDRRMFIHENCWTCHSVAWLLITGIQVCNLPLPQSGLGRLLGKIAHLYHPLWSLNPARIFFDSALYWQFKLLKTYHTSSIRNRMETDEFGLPCPIHLYALNRCSLTK